MDILATFAAGALGVLGGIITALIVRRGEIQREKADKDAAREARLEASRKEEAEEIAARINRLTNVDGLLWTRLQEALAEEREKNAKACDAITARLALVETELSDEREARWALEAAAQGERAQLLDRLATLEKDLKAALAEVAVLRHKNAELEAQLNSKQNKIL